MLRGLLSLSSFSPAKRFKQTQIENLASRGFPPTTFLSFFLKESGKSLPATTELATAHPNAAWMVAEAPGCISR